MVKTINEKQINFCTKAFLLTNFKCVNKIILFKKLSKLDSLSSKNIFYFHVSPRSVKRFIISFMK